MEISTLRWAVVSFLGGVAALALLSIPLVAVCFGAGGASFDRAALTAGLVAGACLVVVVIALDLLGARARRTAAPGAASRGASRAARPAPRRRGPRRVVRAG